ncbi:hypothetical protein AGLY_010700 [Aphis glycines]|uniref:Uncharacterized protein n=1 Tax=Aphis glycines TaxID=307491 RepID=A0A6G0TEX3_APHGL|nr:hypothetical protein AGLY_010700 [Aphis glycines]
MRLTDRFRRDLRYMKIYECMFMHNLLDLQNNRLNIIYTPAILMISVPRQQNPCLYFKCFTLNLFKGGYQMTKLCNNINLTVIHITTFIYISRLKLSTLFKIRHIFQRYKISKTNQLILYLFTVDEHILILNYSYYKKNVLKCNKININVPIYYKLQLIMSKRILNNLINHNNDVDYTSVLECMKLCIMENRDCFSRNYTRWHFEHNKFKNKKPRRLLNHFIIFSRLYTFSICAQYIVNKYCLVLKIKIFTKLKEFRNHPYQICILYLTYKPSNLPLSVLSFLCHGMKILYIFKNTTKLQYYNFEYYKITIELNLLEIKSDLKLFLIIYIICILCNILYHENIHNIPRYSSKYIMINSSFCS